MFLKKYRSDIIEKGIYTFLNSFNKDGNLDKACLNVKRGLNCDDEYADYIVYECHESNLFDGIETSRTANNLYVIQELQNMRITRKGFQFIHQYRLNKFNFFWIPFKNLVIILITALITVLITNAFSIPDKDVKTSDKVISKDIVCSTVCNNSN